jgi:hypothetical protein
MAKGKNIFVQAFITDLPTLSPKEITAVLRTPAIQMQFPLLSDEFTKRKSEKLKDSWSGDITPLDIFTMNHPDIANWILEKANPTYQASLNIFESILTVASNHPTHIYHLRELFSDNHFSKYFLNMFRPLFENNPPFEIIRILHACANTYPDGTNGIPREDMLNLVLETLYKSVYKPAPSSWNPLNWVSGAKPEIVSRQCTLRTYHELQVFRSLVNSHDASPLATQTATGNHEDTPAINPAESFAQTPYGEPRYAIISSNEPGAKPDSNIELLMTANQAKRFDLFIDYRNKEQKTFNIEQLPKLKDDCIAAMFESKVTEPAIPNR